MKETKTMAQRPESSVLFALRKTALPGWAILPLRLFLGGSFIAAGLDKLSDPAFLDPAARDFIGQQITRFAPGTPLEGFLLNLAVPNAEVFGVMTMGGELCIGVAVLLGILTRFSALMGLMLNLTFFLSATWDVRPFYFGADLPYAIGWLTLSLAGPGPFALDATLKRWLDGPPISEQATRPTPTRSGMTRRAFLGASGAIIVAATLGATRVGWGLLHPGKAEASIPAAPTGVETAVPATPAPEANASATVQATTEAAALKKVAKPGELPQGQAMEFSLPSGDPAVLVHNDQGYSAYVALCTHQGCVVRPSASGLFKCPCHGAQYSQKDGSVVQGPARLPLSPVPLEVGSDGSVYLRG